MLKNKKQKKNKNSEVLDVYKIFRKKQKYFQHKMFSVKHKL